MTHTADLVAGRELDALVAEKVMGDKIKWHTDSPSPILFYKDLRRGDYGIMEHQPVPAYSTDIAAAWQVVEHFRERGWQVLVDWDGPRFGAWVCQLWEGEGHAEDLGANAPTAPLAICRAALAAFPLSTPAGT